MRPVLLVQSRVIGRLRGVDQHVLQQHRPAAFPFPHFLLDGDLVLLMPHPPAPLIRRLAQGDAVDPGAQRRLAMKTADAAEDLNEHFLGQVGRIGLVAYGACEQRVNRLMIVCDQPGKRLL